MERWSGTGLVYLDGVYDCCTSSLCLRRNELLPRLAFCVNGSACLVL